MIGHLHDHADRDRIGVGGKGHGRAVHAIRQIVAPHRDRVAAGAVGVHLGRRHAQPTAGVFGGRIHAQFAAAAVEHRQGLAIEADAKIQRRRTDRENGHRVHRSPRAVGGGNHCLVGIDQTITELLVSTRRAQILGQRAAGQ